MQPRWAPLPGAVRVEYEFEADASREGALGQYPEGDRDSPHHDGAVRRTLARSGSRGAARQATAAQYDSIRLVHLPALRNPVDGLSRRDARILLELLRADERRHPETGRLRSLHDPSRRDAQLSHQPPTRGER